MACFREFRLGLFLVICLFSKASLEFHAHTLGQLVGVECCLDENVDSTKTADSDDEPKRLISHSWRQVLAQGPEKDDSFHDAQGYNDGPGPACIQLPPEIKG